MKEKNKLTVITVTATAPAGYSPRKSTFHLVVATRKMSPAIRGRYETEAIALVKEQLDRQNPGIDIRYGAKSTTTNVVGFIASED